MTGHTKEEAYLSATIPKHIRLFEAIRAEIQTRQLSLSQDPIKVTLPDGNVKEGKKWQTTPLHVAREISENLASNALIAMVNGVLWEINRPLEEDSQLQIFRFDDDDTFWHSTADIIGQFHGMEYGCRFCSGPCSTREDGFYYDAIYGNLGLNDDHFKQIEAGAFKAAVEKQPFECIEVTRDQALEIFADNKFKVEIINNFPPDKTITVYRCGALVDLCRTCLKASSAYWMGGKKRESLQSVYGISYPDQTSLKEYLHGLEEGKKYDHRVLGVKQELIIQHEWSPGSWFFLPHGTRIYNKLTDLIRNQYWNRGYQEVISPNVFNMDLWVQAKSYKEDMFVLQIDKQEFGLKPTNCPGHCLVFKHKIRSYRELPLRFADFGVLHRNEASGAFSGLTHARRFQQDDAHIFCRESQIKDEVKRALNFIDYVYQIFGFTYELKLSRMPEKCLVDIEKWDMAENALREALDEFGKPWQLNKDVAFYGPKIDINVYDSSNRKFQCGTLQLDFLLPKRFKLDFSTEDEAKTERPVMIHKSILGSVERIFAILLEHYMGKWPFWLSPRQAILCSVSEKSQAYAVQVRDQIHLAGYQVDANTTDMNIWEKVQEAQLAQYNYILVVGEEEANTGQVSVRVRDKADHSVMSIDNLLKHFKEEVAAFH